MHILMDVDGVVADFAGAYLHTLWKHYNIKATPEQLIGTCFATALGFPEGMERAMFEHMQRDRASSSMMPYPAALTHVIRIRDAGHTITFVTNAMCLPPFAGDYPMLWGEDRANWLVRMFDVGRGDIVFTGAKHLIRGDMLVEDWSKNAKAWLHENPGAKAWLVTRPWNRHTELHGDLLGGTLEELTDYLCPP
jgi:hypothetical protein